MFVLTGDCLDISRSRGQILPGSAVDTGAPAPHRTSHISTIIRLGMIIIPLIFDCKDPRLYTDTIEEGSREKPRQTVVAAFWGKMAAHMLVLRLYSRRVDKRRSGSKMWGDICILHPTVLCVCTQYSTVCWSILSVGGFVNRQLIRNAVKWVHIYARLVVFEIYSLRFSAVSGQFWW